MPEDPEVVIPVVAEELTVNKEQVPTGSTLARGVELEPVRDVGPMDTSQCIPVSYTHLGQPAHRQAQ